MPDIQLEPQYLDELRNIIYSTVDTQRWKPLVFGSRATGKARKTSDIDIALLGNSKVSDEVMLGLWNKLDDSSIPYVVEVVDISQVTPEFRKVALKKVANL